MDPTHLSVEIIMRAINGHVSAKGRDYSSWRIGRREPLLAPALSLTKSVPIVDCWGCKYDDADLILKHFVEKGMEKDDSPLQNNAAQGVYIRQG